MKRWQKWALGICTLLVFLLAASHIVLKQMANAPTAPAAAAQQTATTSRGSLYFGNQHARTTVVMYPGAFVDPGAYSIWAKQVAAAGYRVAIVSFPYDLAVFGMNKADTVLTSNQHYVIGGHSLGGVMASRYAAKHKHNLEGVFFLASYPDAKGKITNTPVLSLTGSRDGVLNWSAYKQAKADLPKTTTYRQLQGGNHAGFGAYGKQKGDKNATVSDATQQKWVARQLIRWLGNL
ncbi:alpha/beta hydrolase [Lacticaseibacillus sharpeae]|uniref:alpha/beta hydrolase n=1 Tax=Lacticaseibacillus sharpeae TaxID=1626 RepID=UPI0006CF3859|nr:alpha/beta hydrolase [Lacticaseibacillus sharpeae]